MSKELSDLNSIANVKDSEQINIAVKQSLQEAEIYNVIDAQNQEIRYLTFGGGGAKGTAYSGVYSALCESKIIDDVLAIAGSSAGAITAAMIATGISPKNFDQLLRQTDLSLLPGKGILINKDGNPLYQLIADNVASNVLRHFDEKDLNQLLQERVEQINNDLENLEKEISKQQKEIAVIDPNLPKFKSIESELDKLLLSNNLLTKYKNILETQGYGLVDLVDKAEKKGKITFGDLKLLNALDPHKFKNLVITAVRRGDGELKIFDPENTPEVEIALACRASGSLPLFFTPAVIDGVEYVDGGFRDNNPTKYFESISPKKLDNSSTKKFAEKEKQRVLIFTFGTNQEDDLAHAAIYSATDVIYNPSKLYKLLVDVMYKSLARIGGDFKYTDTVEETAHQLRKKSHDTVIVDTPGIGTISFKQASEQYDYLHIKGYIQTIEHLNNHKFGSKDTDIDPNLGYKKMILEVYERSVADSSWVSKLLSKNTVKEHEDVILSLLEPSKWKKIPSATDEGGHINSEDREALIKQFITNLASKGNSSICETKNVDKIIAALNSNTISIEVKKEFARILSDGRSEENIYTKKFQEKDFIKLLSEFNANNSNLQKGISRS